ncbi:MAG: hypothetical protein Q9214_002088 [Letrouitia sp. 1 TL-2023]
MVILLTSGTGKTAQSIIPHLRSSSIPFLLASHRPESAPAGTHAAYFDWLDPSSYDTPFTHPSLRDQKITAIYLIAPDIEDTVNIATSFIDRAAEKWGVKRYVLMFGSQVEMGSRGGDVGMPGMIWKHVVEKCYEWAVLRCTWFMVKEYAHAIKDVGKIYSACGDGKIPFVSAKDVGAMAFRALTDAEA